MISIIIPIYNTEKYLKECFDSIQRQSYSDFEVICINDGSTDGSTQICKEIISIDSRFHYIEQKNGGVSKARNKGLEMAKGDFIIFVDADDTLPYNALERYMRYEHGNDTVAGYTHIGNNITNLNLGNNNFNIHLGINYLLKDYLYNNNKYQFCSFLYRKKILDLHCIRFSDDLKYGEDEEFAWKYLSHCKSATTLDTYIYYYRNNINSASHTISFDRVQVIDTMIRVSNYFSSINHPFYDTIFHFGIPRAKLSILKQFALNNRKDLFDQLKISRDYPQKLLRLVLFPNFNIKLASLVYSISSTLFYKILSKKNES